MFLVWVTVILVAVFLLVSAIKKAGDWYSAWLDSDHDPRTGQPVPREPLGRAMLRSLRAPREKRRQEREEYRRRLESLPPEERSCQNPYRRDALRSLLGFLLPIVCFVGYILLLQPLAAGTCYEQPVKLLGYLLLYGGMIVVSRNLYRLVYHLAGFFRFRAYMRRHPGRHISRAAFEAEMKASNGGYAPEDFGR